jgi:RimJ/RimL family protein N-acetyltransferase
MAWPLHALRLVTPDLELRGITEADALALAAVVPDDLAHNPELPDLGHRVEQNYWRELGGWKVDDWVLALTVVHDGSPIGVQAIEGKDFLVRRVVDSYSWLISSARGRGLGKQMRAAALSLAFERLGATHAVTEANEDNAASLGVSRALGYKENGVSVELNDDRTGSVSRHHLALAADEFTSPWPVTIEGLEPCLALFGLAPGAVSP